MDEKYKQWRFNELRNENNTLSDTNAKLTAMLRDSKAVHEYLSGERDSTYVRNVSSVSAKHIRELLAELDGDA